MVSLHFPGTICVGQQRGLARRANIINVEMGICMVIAFVEEEGKYGCLRAPADYIVIITYENIKYTWTQESKFSFINNKILQKVTKQAGETSMQCNIRTPCALWHVHACIVVHACLHVLFLPPFHFSRCPRPKGEREREEKLTTATELHCTYKGLGKSRWTNNMRRCGSHTIVPEGLADYHNVLWCGGKQ